MVSSNGLAQTQYSSAPVASQPIVYPPQSMWFAAIDNNANAFGKDTIFNAGVNLTANIAAFGGLILPNVNDDDMVMTWSSGTNAGWSGPHEGNVTNGALGGVRWGSSRVWTGRGYIRSIGTGPVGWQPAFFWGVAKNIGLSGLFVGLRAVNNPSTAAWQTLIPHCGFYFRPNSDTFWMLVSGDGAGNSNLVSSAIVPNLTRSQTLQFTFDGSTVVFYVNGTKCGQLQSSLPPSNTGMGCCQNMTGTLSGTAATTAGQWAIAYNSLNYI